MIITISGIRSNDYCNQRSFQQASQCHHYTTLANKTYATYHYVPLLTALHTTTIHHQSSHHTPPYTTKHHIIHHHTPPNITSYTTKHHIIHHQTSHHHHHTHHTPFPQQTLPSDLRKPLYRSLRTLYTGLAKPLSLDLIQRKRRHIWNRVLLQMQTRNMIRLVAGVAEKKLLLVVVLQTDLSSTPPATPT